VFLTSSPSLSVTVRLEKVIYFLPMNWIPLHKANPRLIPLIQLDLKKELGPFIPLILFWRFCGAEGPESSAQIFKTERILVKGRGVVLKLMTRLCCVAAAVEMQNGTRK